MVSRVPEALRASALRLTNPPRVLAKAEACLIARCLEGSGYRYVPWETWDLRIPRPEVRLGGLGLPLSVVTAQRHGYWVLIDRIAEVHDADAAEDQYLATLGEVEREAYFEVLDPTASLRATVELRSGVVVAAATTGCAGEARIRIYGNVETFLGVHNFVNQLTGHRREVDEDDRVVTAADAYRTSMANAGYDVTHTAGARKEANRRFGSTRRLSEPVSDEELDMAIADATAQQSSGINAVTQDAVINVLSHWLNAHEEQIRTLDARMARAVKTAHRVLT